jgi:hypothetical protein
MESIIVPNIISGVLIVKEKNMQRKTVKMKNVRSSSATSVRKSMNAENKSVLWFALALLFGTLLVCSVPCYPATYDCSAKEYSRIIKTKSNYIYETYEEKGNVWVWYVENVDKFNEVSDFLLITQYPENYSIIYPLTCKLVK